jgi:hypothetical protein
VSDKFKYNPDTTTGLTFGYDGATYAINGNPITIAAGTVALTDNATNIVEVTQAGLVQAVTLGNESRIFLYKVVTSGGAITSIKDLRASTYQ